MKYEIFFTKQGKKDFKDMIKGIYARKLAELICILENNPYQNPPPYEKKIGSEREYSRRINIVHRLDYEILDGHKIKIISCRTHYHDN